MGLCQSLPDFIYKLFNLICTFCWVTFYSIWHGEHKKPLFHSIPFHHITENNHQQNPHPQLVLLPWSDACNGTSHPSGGSAPTCLETTDSKMNLQAMIFPCTNTFIVPQMVPVTRRKSRTERKMVPWQTFMTITSMSRLVINQYITVFCHKFSIAYRNKINSLFYSSRLNFNLHILVLWNTPTFFYNKRLNFLCIKKLMWSSPQMGAWGYMGSGVMCGVVPHVCMSEWWGCLVGVCLCCWPHHHHPWLWLHHLDRLQQPDSTWATLISSYCTVCFFFSWRIIAAAVISIDLKCILVL